MNINTQGKENLMSDISVSASVAALWNDLVDNTSFSVTSNGFVEVSQTDIKATLVLFDYDL